jgi:REP element-mobilizing transposase RayT
MHKSLFHVTQKHAVQFITFRTEASVAYYLKKNNIEIIKNTSKEQLHLDEYLDNCSAGAIFYGELILLLINFFKSKDNIEYKLIAVSIMPNHVHLLLQQLQPLSIIMHHIKGASGYLINKYSQRSGKLWDRGYFDKVVRDEKQFQVTYDYIKNNAYKAGLGDANDRFYGIYESK